MRQARRNVIVFLSTKLNFLSLLYAKYSSEVVSKGASLSNIVKPIPISTDVGPHRERVRVGNPAVEGLGVDAIDFAGHSPVPLDLELLYLS